jgi:hypothetical protein
MDTSPDPGFGAYDRDGRFIASFGTQRQATDAENAYAQEQIQKLPGATLNEGNLSQIPNFPAGRKVANATSSHPLRKVLLVILIVIIVVIVGIVLLSLLGDYAANHINSHV